MRYLVFSGDWYYPLGGWDDLWLATDDYDTAIREATERASKSYSWAHVVDLTQGRVVWDNGHVTENAQPVWGLWPE